MTGPTGKNIISTSLQKNKFFINMDGNLLTLIGCGFLFFLLAITIIWYLKSKSIKQNLNEFIDRFTQNFE
jgi:hypothetical protein